MESINASDVIRSSTNAISGPKIWSTEHLIPTSVILGIIILCALIGNAFVIAAIILEKSLHCVANYLIVSLATSGFMIASVVMPISAVNEVTQRWSMGSEVCQMWIYMDVVCCTSSILSLLAISIHRYRTIRDINYTKTRQTKHTFTMIAGVWLVSVLIAVPSIVIKDDKNDPTVTGFCMISQDPIYQTCATIVAFYLPSTVLLIIYIKIFVAARERILRKKFSHKYTPFQDVQGKELQLQNNAQAMSYSKAESMASTSESGVFVRQFSGSNGSDRCDNIDDKLGSTDQISIATPQLITLSKSVEDILSAKKEKEKLKKKKEKKLALILTVVTGTFIICWLPFFVLATMTPFMSSNEKIPRELLSITLWLGYCNSLLNPFIYTIFSEDFRNAFKNLLRKCIRRSR